MGFLLTILIVVYFFVCAVMVLLILMQAGKGGGLSGLVGGSALADTFGSTGAEKSLSKFTTWLAIAFFLLTVAMTLIGSRRYKKASLLDRLEQEEAQAVQQQPPQASPAQQAGTPAEQQAPQEITPVAPEPEAAAPGEEAVPDIPEAGVLQPGENVAPIPPAEREESP